MALPTPEEMFQLWRAVRLVSARYKSTGEVVELDGVTISCGDMRWSLVNAAFFSRPPMDEGDATRRLEAAREYFRYRGRKWNMIIWNEWLTGPVLAAIEQCGFKATFRTCAMAAEQFPVMERPWPPELVCRRVTDEAGRIDMMEINAVSYGAPLEYAYEMGRSETIFQEHDFAYVGYVDGKPVTTVAAMPIEGWLNMAWLATLPEYRRRGYAEVIARHCFLAASKANGIERTMLQATEDGYNLYRTIGYHEVTRFTYFSDG